MSKVLRCGCKKEVHRSKRSRGFVSSMNDWCCGLQGTIVVSLYLIGYLRWSHSNSPLPPPELEAPHRLSTWLHISQMLHPPTALLLLSLLLSSFSPCAFFLIDSYFPPVFFLPICLSPTVHLLSLQWPHYLELPSVDPQSRGLGVRR